MSNRISGILIVAAVVLALLLIVLGVCATCIDNMDSQHTAEVPGGTTSTNNGGTNGTTNDNTNSGTNGTTTVPPTSTTTMNQSAGYTLTLTVEGEDAYTLEYGSAFAIPGATAWIHGEKLGQEGLQVTDITVEHQLNLDKVGTYTITYFVRYSIEDVELTAGKSVTVRIVDTQAPVIQLVEDENDFTYPGRPYQELGFTAIDGHDGDITDRVIRTEENGVVTYWVKDASGNEATATRTIRYDDPEAPILSLKGDNPMSILVGSDFVEPGVIAWDGCDGYISEQVVISNIEIDPYVPGTYVITYSVTDRAGNTASIERTLQVEAYELPAVVRPNGKAIYLTFDDGPGPYTEKLLDVLKQYNVKATFFVVNTKYMVNNNRYDILKRIVDEGHAIAIHCADHTYGNIYVNEESYFSDLEKMQQIIYEHTGVLTKLVRFPGGSSNTVSKYWNETPGLMTRLTKALLARGYQYFDWNVDSDDAGGATTKEKVYNNVINGCSSRTISIVLQHDIKAYSVNAVEDIIKWGLANGYQFLPLALDSPYYHHYVNN